MTAPVHRVLSGLEAVRSTGPDNWIARCPAHEDRSPSLSIREGTDGRVLLHCFAGCGGTEVVSALGLDFADLFPPRQPTTYANSKGRKPARTAPRISAESRLQMLEREALTVQLIAHRLSKGDPVERHAEDLALASERISTIRHGLGGTR